MNGPAAGTQEQREDETTDRIATTYDHCSHVVGPFFHGTRATLEVGVDLLPGHRSHFRPGRPLLHVYFTGLVETAVWGAELAAALHPGDGGGLPLEVPRGRVYVVEPQGPFEDDPNVTDKKLPGNPTQSYRTTHPLRVVDELDGWEGHSPEVLQGMLNGLARLRAEGLDVIED